MNHGSLPTASIPSRDAPDSTHNNLAEYFVLHVKVTVVNLCARSLCLGTLPRNTQQAPARPHAKERQLEQQREGVVHATRDMV